MIGFCQKIGTGREIHNLSPAPFSEWKACLTDSVDAYFVQAKCNLPSYKPAPVVDSQEKGPLFRSDLLWFKPMRVKSYVPDADYAGGLRRKGACIRGGQLRISIRASVFRNKAGGGNASSTR